MNNKKTEKSMAFAKITTPSELAKYLDNVSSRLQKRVYLYHYTKLPNLIAMFRSKCWHLCSAKDMNDLLEYKNGDSSRWNNLFFASFMTESKESIGMWSMYSQPWERGVKIAIPVAIVKNWIKKCTEIFEVDLNTKQLTGQKIKISPNVTLWLSSVAYSNAESLEYTGMQETISWSNRHNSNIKNATTIPELTGYIKDNAWDYEKEVRLKAEFDNIHNFKRVAIALPDEVLDAMIITAGPLFEGDLLDEIKKEIQRTVETDTSLFSGNLKLESICINCSYKKGCENCLYKKQ